VNRGPLRLAAGTAVRASKLQRPRLGRLRLFRGGLRGDGEKLIIS